MTIQLLEEHLTAMRREANADKPYDSGDELSIDEADDAGWSDWEQDSESSESSGWESVSSEGDEFEISDSEDEEREKLKASKEKLKSKMKAKAAAKAKAQTEESEGDDDDEGEGEEGLDEWEETKSVVSGTTTEFSLATKKLSLLAQQKVS